MMLAILIIQRRNACPAAFARTPYGLLVLRVVYIFEALFFTNVNWMDIAVVALV